DFVIFAELRFGIVADDAAREAGYRAPDRAVGRVGADAIHAGADPHVLLRVHRSFWFYPTLVALAIAVDVEDERRPSLARLLVMGRIPLPPIKPADDIAGAATRAEPERVVLIELQVMRGEAQIDHIDLARLGIIHFRLALRARQRENLRIR